MKVTQYVIDPSTFDGYCKHILYDGVDPYHPEKSAEDYIAEGLAVLSEEEYFKAYDEYNKSLCGDWREITEETYDDMLNILPPLKWHNGGFFCMEAYAGTIHSFYQELNGKYYTSLQDITTPRRDILKSLKWYIKEMNIGNEEESK